MSRQGASDVQVFVAVFAKCLALLGVAWLEFVLGQGLVREFKEEGGCTGMLQSGTAGGLKSVSSSSVSSPSVGV